MVEGFQGVIVLNFNGEVFNFLVPFFEVECSDDYTIVRRTTLGVSGTPTVTAASTRCPFFS